MKIIREGKEIELTSDELFNAYLEQEHLFDIQNIVNNMENHLSESEYEELKDNRDFIECAADELRRNQNKYDMDYEYALSYAFNDVKGEFLDIQKDVKKSYFEVHITFGEKDGDGYSIFVELEGPAGAQEALDKVRDEHLYQEPEDLNNIDYIDEIDKHQYYECIGKEMPVESWEDMQMKYPTVRDEMDEETEKAFVEDCFRLYEKEGFSDVYWSPFTDNEDRKGQKIEILGRCTIEDNDLCVLPMWKAKFSDGKILDVYPEEVIPSEMRANGCRLFDDKKTSLLSVQTTWITVYKDSLGYPDDSDNLTQICVPTQWLYSLLKEDGEDIQSIEDIESWFSEYTADSTDIIARKALAEDQIHDCSDQNIKLSLFIDMTKEKTYQLLEASNKNKKTVDLDINTSEYKSATDLISSFCQGTFPELYDAVFGNSNSDMFFEDASGGYHMYYYNPDSNVGGQIVDCPFDVEQASRMFNCEDYIDVLAENTQYLSDIDTYHFFDSIFDLLERKKSGLFLGTDRDSICKAICEKHGIDISANKKPSLTSQIQTAVARTQSPKNSSDIKSKETELIL